MTRLDIVTQVETISNVTSQRTLTNLSVQIALNRVVEYFEWPYYLQPGVINTVAPYSTGTAKVTNGSATITGVGTIWTSAMVGRKFRHANENAYYRISGFTSVTSLTIDTPYQGSTDSTGSSYSIHKDEYRLAPDVDTYKTILQIQNGVPMASISPAKFDKFFPTPQSLTSPVIEVMSGTKLDIYTTGTVSATVSTTTITGSATSWLSVEGLGRMSNIIIGANRYTVKSVDSDTQLTVYESIIATVSATTYQINLNNLRIQTFPIPNSQENLYYRYYRVPEFMVNNYDVPDMPNQWHYLLIYGALSFMFLEKGDIQKSENVAEMRFLEGLQNMKKKLGSFAPDRIYRRQSQDKAVTSGDGLEKSTFDRRYSGF